MQAANLLKTKGADGEKSTVALLNWFLNNPGRWISTTDMGLQGIKFTYRNGKVCFPNQATLERKARNLREFGFVESRKDGRYELFRLAETISPMERPHYFITDPVTGERTKIYKS